MIEGVIVRVKEGDDWVDGIDVHHMDTYRMKMPYGWKVRDAVVIDGIPTERLCDQLHKRGVTTLNPGVGIEGRGKIGPEAAQTPTRLKDIKKIEVVAGALIRAARREGKTQLASQATGYLREFLGKLAKGYPSIGPVKARRASLSPQTLGPKPKRVCRGRAIVDDRGRVRRQRRRTVLTGLPAFFFKN